MENDPKGAYTRSPVFTGENYSYWKDCMCVHIASIDRKIWKVIEDGPMAITMTKDNVTIPKPKALWDENDEENYAYDWKGRNMLIAALGVDEFF